MLSSFALFPSFLLLTFPFTHLCSLPPSNPASIWFSPTLFLNPTLCCYLTCPLLSPCLLVLPPLFFSLLPFLLSFSTTFPFSSSTLLFPFHSFLPFTPFSLFLSLLPSSFPYLLPSFFFPSLLPFSFSSPLPLSLSSPLFLLSLSFFSLFLLFFTPLPFLIFSLPPSFFVVLFSLSPFHLPSPFPYLLPSFFFSPSLHPFSLSSLILSLSSLLFLPFSSPFPSPFLLFSFFLSPFLIFCSPLFLPSYFPFSPTTPVYHYYSHKPRELLPTSIPQKVRNQMPKVFSRHR